MKETTEIILWVIFGLVALVLGILNYINKRNEVDTNREVKQKEIEVTLINIQKELIEIKSLLVASCEKYELLDKRVLYLENKKIRKGEK